MTYRSILAEPPIHWGFWIVYYRYPDDRVMYFRGTRRNDFFIKNLLCGKGGDWSWEPDYARLFQFKPSIILDNIAKKLGEETRQEILLRTSYQGFNETVLSTHLRLPRG